jgi:large subunit ribosomal protein L53
MITRFITEVYARFNPFNARAKVVRVFLAQFGPSTFPKIKFHTSTLPKMSVETSRLKVKFSESNVRL